MPLVKGSSSLARNSAEKKATAKFGQINSGSKKINERAYLSQPKVTEPNSSQKD